MSTPDSIAAVDSAHAVNTDRTAGTVELLKPPREAVEWMESPDRPTDLWWTTKVRGEADPYWHELKSAAQIADLVHALTDPQDTLTLDDEPPTRYAQTMLLGDGLFMVEIAKRFEGLGAYNWRIGRGRAADDAANDPQDLVQPLQELTAAETIEVLVSWAQGHGLPLPYGAALRTYGNPPDLGLVA